MRAITRALRDDPALFERLQHREGRHATPEELALVHDPRYVAAIEALCERLAADEPGAHARLGSDTVASPGSWLAATVAAGCVLDGVDLALDGRAVRSFSAVRPPGHHALHHEAMGFCLFGSVACAARYARTRHRLERVLIIDWDVHHGNGTQALVEADAGVRFVSMHQWPWYPGTGAADDHGPHHTIWNVPMPGDLPPARYVEALLGAVDAATTGWTPELVLISAGFDSLRDDPLGGFTLELEHVDELTRAVVDRATTWCDGRVVSALEGGYAPDRVAAACVAHLRALE